MVYDMKDTQNLCNSHSQYDTCLRVSDCSNAVNIYVYIGRIRFYYVIKNKDGYPQLNELTTDITKASKVRYCSRKDAIDLIMRNLTDKCKIDDHNNVDMVSRTINVVIGWECAPCQ